MFVLFCFCFLFVFMYLFVYFFNSDVIGDTSGDYKTLLLAILACKRTAPEVPTDPVRAAEDAKTLYRAGV